MAENNNENNTNPNPNPNNTTAASLQCDSFYQISDDDLDDCEDLPDDCLIDTTDGANASSSSNAANNNGHPRGPYERAWTTEATRALIHIRGPMEHLFTEGRQKRTALWLHCTRQLQKMGFRYSAAKVQKKWHNILITYNKNLCKKYTSGYVHWEFFEEMFKYLQGKRAHFDFPPIKKQPPPMQIKSSPTDNFNLHFLNAKQEEVVPHPVELDSKSNDDFDEEDSTTMSDIKKPKLEFNEDNHYEYPLEIIDSNNYTQPNSKMEEIENEFLKNFGKDQHMPMHVGNNSNNNNGWWQEYFERKLQVERDKIELQKEMHRELMQFNKMSLLQQEKIERVKIEAINSLTSTLQKLVEVKYNKQN
ncbi:hypothetical protein FF38_02645 [Lucilia cuprina]|uniref:Myb/SANT-like DNA-binding domain-containing protein n=1 Tax=Lucilia cuprina TaxID=7375 RepID=A0A0L0C4K4_LUCCU|nr:hypothetical protein CVS40_10180 [Lucilia cuprina]KNC27187.1 hypothetical protein FF38_02645 [Lucilia cuprina]